MKMKLFTSTRISNYIKKHKIGKTFMKETFRVQYNDCHLS